jgi:hypothetical protein
MRCAFNKKVTYFFTLCQFIFNKSLFGEHFDYAQKLAGIRLLKFLAGDRECLLQVFRCQAGWQTIGIRGWSAAHLTRCSRDNRESSGSKSAPYPPGEGSAYQDFLTLWKDVDPDIPILKEAKAEYAKLR